MKKLMILCLAGLSMSCLAGEQDAAKLARQQYAASVSAFEGVNADCVNKADVLPANTLGKSQLDKEQKLIAFKYFYYKTQAICASGALAKYTVAASTLAQFGENYQDLVADSNLLILAGQVDYLKAEVAYQALPSDLRQALSKVDVLQKPFKLAESAEAVGLR